MTLFRSFRYKGDVLALAGILAGIGIFFHEMVFLQQGFFSGDHRLQHYPWAVFLGESLQQGQLPWWTNLFHGGFPLLAEGQIGGLYPFNLIFYRILPFPAAYTYNILFHYVLSGLFFYGYVRSAGAGVWGSVLGTLIYLFGTAQGGYYYNIISLKTLAWFPLTLWLIDRIVASRRMEFLWLGLVLAMQLLAGYLQYAVYSVAMTSLYALWRTVGALRSESRERRVACLVRNAGCFLAALGVAILVSLPQLGSTFELARCSNRFSYPEEFAYVGSLNPLAVATLFFPHWDGFLRAELYVGALGLFFLILALSRRPSGRMWFFIALALLSLAVALGKFNPLYVFVVKLTGFSGFRIPTKMLYFTATSLAFLCAVGASRWLDESRSRLRKQADRWGKIFAALGITSVIGWVIAFFVLAVLRAPIEGFLATYIREHYGRSPIHPHPVESYLARLGPLYENILETVRLTSGWNWFFVSFMAVSLLWVWTSARKKTISLPVKFFGVVILFFNLYGYGFTSVKGNYETINFIQQPTELLQFFQKAGKDFRIHRIVSDLEEADTTAFPPHVNMLYHIPTTGAYSPLVMASYYELFQGLGDVNDSNHLLVADPQVLKKSAELLDFLNIKYLLSEAPLEDGAYEPVFKVQNTNIYLNPDFLPRAYFINRLRFLPEEALLEVMKSPNFNPSRVLYLSDRGEVNWETGEREYFVPAEVLKDSQQEILVRVNAPVKGYLVISDIFYPGWRAAVNGKEVGILKGNGFFKAVPIDNKGRTQIRLWYDPVWKHLVPVSAGVGSAAFVLPFFVVVRKRRKQG